MTKPTIKEFHNYVYGKLSKKILKKYRSFQILSESDLQSYVWYYISKYLRNTETEKGLHKVHNNHYIKELDIHPDIAIFRRKKPWIIFELKEGRKLKKPTVLKEFRD